MSETDGLQDLVERLELYLVAVSASATIGDSAKEKEILDAATRLSLGTTVRLAKRVQELESEIATIWRAVEELERAEK